MTTRVYLPLNLLLFQYGNWESASQGWEFLDQETGYWLKEHVGMMWDGVFVERRLTESPFGMLITDLYATNRPYLLFIEEDDATLFKLTWC